MIYDSTFNDVDFPGGLRIAVPKEANLIYETEIDTAKFDRLESTHRWIFSARGAFGLTRYYQDGLDVSYGDHPNKTETQKQIIEMSLTDILRTDYRTLRGRWRAAVLDIRRWLKKRIPWRVQYAWQRAMSGFRSHEELEDIDE